MRILTVNALLDPKTGGGAAERTFQLSRALAEIGAQTSILTLDVGITPGRRRDLSQTRIVALPWVQRRFLVPRYQKAQLSELMRSVDVVHIVGHWTPINVIAFNAAVAAGRPYVVCPAGALPIFGRSKTLKRLFNLAVGNRLIRGASGWVAITEAERDQFSLYNVARDQVRVIPNGVRMEDFRPQDDSVFRTRSGIGARRFVLFMGRLNPIKGPDILLAAFAAIAGEHREVDLAYAGPDEGMGRELAKLAEAQGIAERVHFLGHVHGNDKVAAYQGCEFLVVPSRQEAMSIVALEAGACSKPVLLTDQCGFDEVESAGGGRIVPADPRAIAAAMRQMLSDRQTLSAMGERLHALVEAHYTWTRAARDYLGLFSRLRPESP
jgi:glycosyltransferase involved in cell wall biosynthesis